MDAMERTTADLRRFHISETHGFLLTDALDELPQYFSPWENLAKNLPKLLVAKCLRNEVHKLPVLDPGNLRGYREHRLAYLYLSFLTNGYVWQDGDTGVPKVLPRQLAVPVCYLANYMGSKPALSHCSFCLSNWNFIDASRSPTVENLRTICRFPGGEQYDWFTLVTVGVELACVPALKAMAGVVHSVEEHLDRAIVSHLKTMTEALVSMKQTLSRFHEKLSSNVFYNVFRPFLAGWGETGSPLPDGLIYEGVSDDPVKVCGGSAAQSSVLNSFDAALGIRHEKDKQEFLDNMLEYMPRDHRNFVLYLRERSSLKEYVTVSTNIELLQAYDACVSALRDFRSYHISLVTKYIVIPSRSQSRNKDYDCVSQKGTGGTPLIPFLQSVRNTTKPKPGE